MAKNDDVSLRELEIINAHMARALKEEMPPGYAIGWVLITFDFGPKGFMTYASNSQRADVVKLLRELASKIEGS